MARDGDDRFAKVTPTAAQVGFSQAGDPFPSFDERQVAVLEDLMWDHGALGRPQMAGTFAAIRAEANAPRADVFWNNEVSQTVALAQEGALEPYASPNAEGLPAYARDPEQRWTGFAARARVLLVNTELVAEEETPRSLAALSDPRWRGRCGIAKPLFGTTATQVAARYFQD